MNQQPKRIAFLILFSLTISTSFFYSCDEGGISEKDYETQFYKRTQLNNIYDNEISSLTQQFINESSALVTKSEAFQLESNLQNLEATQEQWKNILGVWKQLELYNLGEITNSFIVFDINYWPTNTESIENHIADNTLIDETFINSIGAFSKGVSSLEYLLFKENQQNTLNSFTSDVNASRRLNYLLATSRNLESIAIQLKSIWSNYSHTFTTALETGISGSQNLVNNAMIFLIEQIIMTKLGNPLGDSNGGSININELEAYRSETSLFIIQQHLTALQRCFTGDFAKTPYRIGFKDYLTETGNEALSLSIIQHFEDCQYAIDNIQSSLKNELINNPENVDHLKQTFRDLLVLIKVDMANAIGSTVTFNANDGD